MVQIAIAMQNQWVKSGAWAPLGPLPLDCPGLSSSTRGTRRNPSRKLIAFASYTKAYWLSTGPTERGGSARSGSTTSASRAHGQNIGGATPAGAMRSRDDPSVAPSGAGTGYGITTRKVGPLERGELGFDDARARTPTGGGIAAGRCLPQTFSISSICAPSGAATQHTCRPLLTRSSRICAPFFLKFARAPA
jgi:hypothetical protein